MSDLATAPPAPLSGAPDADVLGKVLDELPPGASGARVWAQLGRSGLVESAYREGVVSRARAGVLPDRLGALLAAVDARFSVGATLSTCVQLATVVPILATGTGPAERALARVVAGSATAALAATDAGTGSDLTALATEVSLGDDEVVVTGTKRWITNATTAEYFLVLARHRPGRHFTSFTWVLVPAAAPGVAVGPADSELFDGSGVGHVEFDGVRLSREHVVGRPGRALASFARHIGTERLAGALWAVALCRRVLEDTLNRLSARPHGDATLWDLSGVRQRFAACLVQVRQLRALVDQFGERIATAYDTSAAALLKAAVGSTVDRVLAECAQLQGAEGFATGGAQRLRAQAAIFGIGGGTTEVVLSAVADDAVSVLAELDVAPWPTAA
ncbi:acyl-CoA dehydrogenase family protein [Actinokineospora sp. G85]|uniref:acyl-CoA dehydrogenase family protein n=1 Tax=Actinokineospora sp. G85 TaxID=3406626 RepID=UPI003C77F77F